MNRFLTYAGAMIGMIAGAAVIVLGLSLLLTWPFMWLWNKGVVAAFPHGVGLLSYWEAYCLLVLLFLALAAKDIEEDADEVSRKL